MNKLLVGAVELDDDLEYSDDEKNEYVVNQKIADQISIKLAA